MKHSKLQPSRKLNPTASAACALLTLLFCLAGIVQAAPPPGNWTLTWNDDFNGTSLDATKWSTGMRTPDIINDELQAYHPDQVTVANGVCTIKVEKKTTVNTAYGGHTGPTKAYASGALTTWNKWTQAYGYFEARVKMSSGPGTWPAFWLMPDRGASVTPLSTRVGIGTRGGVVAMGNEIDIFEYMATWKNQTTGLSKSHSGYFWQYDPDLAASAYTLVNQLASPDTQFHTYGVAWSPGKLVYYIDGTAVATLYGRTSVASCPEYLILNCAMSTNDWTGTPVSMANIDADLPCTMEIDNIQVYSGTPAPVAIVNGVYETEAVVAATSSDEQTVAYDTAASNGAYEGLAADAVGDYINYTVPVASAGTYNVKTRFKRAALSTSNRGQWQLSIDGTNQGAVQDEYGSGIFVEVDLGNVTFASAGNKSFKFTVTGKNASSLGYNVNFDRITLTPVSSLPSPWVNQDVGAVGVAGSSSYASGSFTINGSGADIGGTADAFQYVYQAATGDCSIIAKVESITQTDYNAKAGVMMRQSLADAGSPNAFMYIPKLNKAVFNTRSASGGSTTSVPNGTAIIHPPNWVKLTRVGDVFTGYFSTDGVAWTQVGSQTIAMPSTIYLGLPATSRVNTLLTTAVISNVTAVP
jgi:beta-glucanase (GH16 family)